MTWTIEFYSEKVEQFIFDDLPDGLLARYVHLSRRMVALGPNLKEPHTKSLGDGLFSVRLKTGKGLPAWFIARLSVGGS